MIIQRIQNKEILRFQRASKILGSKFSKVCILFSFFTFFTPFLLKHFENELAFHGFVFLMSCVFISFLFSCYLFVRLAPIFCWFLLIYLILVADRELCGFSVSSNYILKFASHNFCKFPILVVLGWPCPFYNILCFLSVKLNLMFFFKHMNKIILLAVIISAAMLTFFLFYLYFVDKYFSKSFPGYNKESFYNMFEPLKKNGHIFENKVLQFVY